MMLTLQIENFNVLDDGGPVSILVPETGIQVGRRPGMDWVLPDASRYISGLHFEVSFDGTSWWLRDVSTNGTFLHGHRHRLDGAHSLSHGDRFQVGQYIIVAIFGEPEAKGMISPGSLPAHRVDLPVQEVVADDPWAVGGSSAEPIDVIPPEQGEYRHDFADDFVEFNYDIAPETPPAPAAPPVSPPVPQAAAPVPPVSAPQSVPPKPVSQPPAPAPVSAPAVAAPPASPVNQQAFLKGFCRGAGLDSNIVADADPEAMGQMLGETMKIVSEHLMLALRDRSTARHFTRSGERTMRGATDNNPLKFLPDAAQAMEALFLRPRAGFMVGAAGYDEALGDLRRHQAALFAALQPALIDLLHDLDPGRIEAEAKGGGLGASISGGKKAKAWDSFVSKWDAKTASENGILDEFIRLFAAAYRKAGRACCKKE